MVGAINFSYFGRLRVCYRTKSKVANSPQHVPRLTRLNTLQCSTFPCQVTPTDPGALFFGTLHGVGSFLV